MKKKIITVGVITISFVLVLAFGLSQYKENQQYERYLSHRLVNDISGLASSTVMNSNYLAEITTEKQITKDQLDYLRSNFVEIFKNGGEAVELAEEWLKLKKNEKHFVNPYPVYMASSFGHFLRQLEEAKFSADNTLTLSSEQVENFELMKSVNDAWVKAILDNIDGIQSPTIEELENDTEIVTENYFEMYRENMINSDDWVDMIKQMQSTSKQYELDVENAF